MKNIAQIESKKTSNMLWLLIGLLTIATGAAVYFFQFNSAINAIIGVCWLVVVVFIASLTIQGKQLYEFAKESKIELQKVVWPTRQETVQTTSIVMIMVAVTGIILWSIDSGMMWIIGKITHLG